MEKRWRVIDADGVRVRALQSELKVRPVICRLLVQRGVDSFEKARAYFRPSLTDLHDPFGMKDMDKAVERILGAVDAGEKILVFGDYDVDGTTSVACMYHFLSRNADVETLGFYLPNRYTEGYGISQRGIDFARDNGFTLVISLDCGIKSVGLVKAAAEMGIDFIICDHHLPDTELPPAVAILNPKQPGCGYPYKDLCGCGVGFKLITALAFSLGLEDPDYLMYLDLVATAIAADIVPMTGENRVLAHFGLQKANADPNPGIAALISISQLKKPLTITNLVFMIAPRVNAAGRMDDARKAVDMFLAGTTEEAERLAGMLHSDNTERQGADKLMTEEALALLGTETGAALRRTTVVFQPHWHKGVVGIVASRLIERYFRPTVVLTRSGDLISGSARSVPGFNLYEAIHAAREHLITYGGHFAAAGLTLHPDQLAKFRDKFEEVVAAAIDPEMLIPEILIAAEVKLGELTPAFYKILRQMEPFGPDNAKPVFVARSVQDSGYSKILKDDHIRFVVQQAGVTIAGIGFNLAGKFSLMAERRPVDLVFTLDENEYNGEARLQLKVIDIRTAD